MKSKQLSKLTRKLTRIKMKAIKHSPEILVITGVVGVVVTTVTACKATTKLKAITDETKENLEKIKTCIETGISPDYQPYSREDGRSDTAIVYLQTGVSIAKLYLPSITIGTLSIISILASHKILKKRNVAISAAYTAVDTAFKDYRGRVIDRFGSHIDKELKFNTQQKEVEVVEKDENGKEKKTTRVINQVVGANLSEYAAPFGRYSIDDDGNAIPNPHWCDCNEYNLMHLKDVERFMNDKLRINGILFLNEVYEALGMPKRKSGQIVGWVYDENRTDGEDNFVDFGIYTTSDTYNDYLLGYDDEYWLDFNVNGNVWDLM